MAFAAKVVLLVAGNLLSSLASRPIYSDRMKIGLYNETAFRSHAFSSCVPSRRSSTSISVHRLHQHPWVLLIVSFLYIGSRHYLGFASSKSKTKNHFDRLGSPIYRNTPEPSACRSSTAANILGIYFQILWGIDVYMLFSGFDTSLVNRVFAATVQHHVRILIGFWLKFVNLDAHWKVAGTSLLPAHVGRSRNYYLWEQVSWTCFS